MARIHVKYLLFLFDFNETFIFPRDIRKILKYKISRKSVQWKPSCFVRTVGLTGIQDEAKSRFSQFFERA